MDIVKQNTTFSSDNLDWILSQTWLKDRKNVLLALLVGSTSIAFAKIGFPFLQKVIASRAVAQDTSLPMGLPNNSNFCYLNALLQAMASNDILVKSLRQSGALKRSRILCYLVVILEGLQCSLGYLTRHHLVEIILLAHSALIKELSLSGKWTISDQQDVHELYGFFMNLAESDTEANESTQAVSRLLPLSLNLPGTNADLVNDAGAQHIHHSACLSLYPSFSPVSAVVRRSSYFTSSPLHSFVASQIYCSKCSYRGELGLVPESSIILFPKKSRTLHTKNMSSKLREEYKVSLEVMLSDEFAKAERLIGVHCPQCEIEALRVPENLINDPSPTISDRSAIRRFAESMCRNTCYARRWIAAPPIKTPSMRSSSLVIYLQRAYWLSLKDILPSDDAYVVNFSAGGMMVKYTDHISFPAVLDMKPYVAKGAVSAALVRRFSGKSGSGYSWKSASYSYALRSVIVHLGNSLYTGHYISYRLWRRNNSSEADWIVTSDRHVSHVPFSDVQACQAYMLFYEPIEKISSNSGTLPTTAATESRGVVQQSNGEREASECEINDGEGEEDGVMMESIVNIAGIISPARRIRALMLLASGVNEIA